MNADDRFKELREQLEHPDPTPFPAKYEPAVRVGQMLYLAGEGPRWGSTIRYRGSVWESLSVEEARSATEITTLNLLWSTQQEIGSLERVSRVAEVVGFVRSHPNFSQHPRVLDKCSQILLDVFGAERGKHARCALGAHSLPLNICVEIKMTLHLEDS